MAQKPICGLGQKWPNSFFFAISAAVAQVVHAVWPKRFIRSQVTQYASFREKIFFRLTFLKNFFALENFRNFRLKTFSTNEIRDMEVQQRAKFSLTKPHHIVLKSTATSYLCGSFKKITILRSFSQGKKLG